MKNDLTTKSKESAQNPANHPLATLASHLDALKRLPRTGWRDRGLPEVESVAAHGFGVVVWTLWLAERANQRDPGSVDIGKALKLATLHDLPEAELGDLTPRQKRLLFGASKADQKQAIGRGEQRYWAQWDHANSPILQQWGEEFEEYRAQKTTEARLVKQADALDCVWQAISYRQLYPERLEEFRYLLTQASGKDTELHELLNALWTQDVHS